MRLKKNVLIHVRLFVAAMAYGPVLCPGQKKLVRFLVQKESPGQILHFIHARHAALQTTGVAEDDLQKRLVNSFDVAVITCFPT